MGRDYYGALNLVAWLSNATVEAHAFKDLVKGECCNQWSNCTLILRHPHCHGFHRFHSSTLMGLEENHLLGSRITTEPKFVVAQFDPYLYIDLQRQIFKILIAKFCSLLGLTTLGNNT